MKARPHHTSPLFEISVPQLAGDLMLRLPRSGVFGKVLSFWWAFNQTLMQPAEWTSSFTFPRLELRNCPIRHLAEAADAS
jgi:hypothetical protein